MNPTNGAERVRAGVGAVTRPDPPGFVNRAGEAGRVSRPAAESLGLGSGRGAETRPIGRARREERHASGRGSGAGT